MNLFANSTGRTIGPDNTEAVTLAIYKFGQSLKALEMEQAMSQQNGITRRVLQTIRDYDVLLTPGLVRDVAKLGEFDQNAKDLDILGWWNHIVQNYSAFTPLFNTTGQPAVMLPLWQAASGLPLAMQFVGRAGDEETLYSLAGQLEQAAPWATRRPAHFA
jgi:amidase